jgi:hypothetical protein
LPGPDGFGDDPVFLYPPLGRTFAELTPDDKSRVDHRGAVGALRARLAPAQGPPTPARRLTAPSRAGSCEQCRRD